MVIQGTKTQSCSHLKLSKKLQEQMSVLITRILNQANYLKKTKKNSSLSLLLQCTHRHRYHPTELISRSGYYNGTFAVSFRKRAVCTRAYMLVILY
jgi:hypothetical protein